MKCKVDLLFKFSSLRTKSIHKLDMLIPVICNLALILRNINAAICE